METGSGKSAAWMVMEAMVEVGVGGAGGGAD
jgi:hypothetical protein